MFKYIGFQLKQTEDGITLTHTKYTHTLENHTVHPQTALQMQDCLFPKEQTLFRKGAGQINWIVQSSRPDMAFKMIDLSTKLKVVWDILQYFLG